MCGAGAGAAGCWLLVVDRCYPLFVNCYLLVVVECVRVHVCVCVCVSVSAICSVLSIAFCSDCN